MNARSWKLWEPAPAGRAPWPPGRWRDDDGTPLHGVWGRPEPDATETVVVANHGHALLGWRVPRRRWRFASEFVRASSCALAQIPWVWAAGGQLTATDPPDVAVGLVLAGRKPVALADTADELLARRWVETAARAGLRVTAERAVFDCGPVPTSHWFVRAAVPGRFADLFDLDVLIDDYAACLTGEQRSDVERTIDKLRACEVADVAEDPDLIVPATCGQWARTGLALGYHPATTAGLILHGSRTSWAEEGSTTLVIDVLARTAVQVGLPGLPTCLAREREGVR